MHNFKKHFKYCFYSDSQKIWRFNHHPRSIHLNSKNDYHLGRCEEDGYSFTEENTSELYNKDL